MADIIRQGDVLLVPSPLPDGAEVQPDRVGLRIEGERGGHAHTLVGPVATGPAGGLYVHGGNVLQHEEHKHIQTEPVWYRVHQQRVLVAGRPEMGVD